MNKISVFIAGETSSTIKKKVGPKKNWYLDVLCSDSNVSFYDIYKNDHIPSFQSDDLWIISGSEFSVYDDLTWLNRFKYKILEAIKRGKPILGICFGHQLLANVLGGSVVKNKLGWEVGYAPIELTSNGANSLLYNNFPNNF